MVAWTWPLAGNAFGSAQPIGSLLAPNCTGRRCPSAADDMNLRFPGQQYDVETGLHYNYFRYYDPITGRYLQPDPIGLEGGSSTYAYVGGDSINSMDPLGPFDVRGRRFSGGEYRGQVRFSVSFYGLFTGRLRDLKAILIAPLPREFRWFDKGITYLEGDPA